LHAEVPPKLVESLRALVDAGWYPDLDAAVRDALQRFADSHQDALLEKFVREDVEWGLRGDD
jgi:Arc/MetJ-type ribon-helix-helix transcriptional regulator